MNNKILIIRVGGNMLDDIKKLEKNSSKAIPNSTTTYINNIEELSKLFTRERLRLLNYLLNRFDSKKTITQISNDLKRKQEAVSRDINALTKNKIITKTKEKQSVFPKTSFKEIRILIKN